VIDRGWSAWFVRTHRRMASRKKFCAPVAVTAASRTFFSDLIGLRSSAAGFFENSNRNGRSGAIYLPRWPQRNRGGAVVLVVVVHILQPGSKDNSPECEFHPPRDWLLVPSGCCGRSLAPPDDTIPTKHFGATHFIEPVFRNRFRNPPRRFSANSEMNMMAASLRGGHHRH